MFQCRRSACQSRQGNEEHPFNSRTRYLASKYCSCMERWVITAFTGERARPSFTHHLQRTAISGCFIPSGGGEAFLLLLGDTLIHMLIVVCRVQVVERRIYGPIIWLVLFISCNKYGHTIIVLLTSEHSTTSRSQVQIDGQLMEEKSSGKCQKATDSLNISSSLIGLQLVTKSANYCY